jgi:hypothetical protein
MILFICPRLEDLLSLVIKKYYRIEQYQNRNILQNFPSFDDRATENSQTAGH